MILMRSINFEKKRKDFKLKIHKKMQSNDINNTQFESIFEFYVL